MPQFSIKPGLEQRHPGACVAKAQHEQCSNQVFLDKTRNDMMQVLDVYYKLQEAFYNFPKQFVQSRQSSPAPVMGEKEFYWMACELLGAACVDSFMERNQLTMSTGVFKG